MARSRLVLHCRPVKTYMILVALSLVLACGSSKSESGEQAAPAGNTADSDRKTAPSKPDRPSQDEGLPIATKLDCSTLIPTDVVTKHFPGATITQFDNAAARKRLNLPPEPAVVGCAVDNDMGPITIVEFKCNIYLDDQSVATTYAQVASDKLIPDLGRGAGELPGQISVADDDTACIIVMSYLGKRRDQLVALARDIVPRVTPAAIGAAP